MQSEEVEELLKRAELEEKAYNWVQAATLYEKVVNSFLNEKSIKKAAEIYYKLGMACNRGADTVDTIEERGELLKNSINAFEDATNLYKQSGNKPEELECNALEFLVRGMNTSSEIESKKAFSQSLELFLEASELYSKENYQDKCVRSLSWVVMVSVNLVLLSIDPKEIEEFCQKGIEIANKAWKLSKDVENNQMLAEIIYNEAYLIIDSSQIKDNKQDQYVEGRNYLLKCEESLNIVKDCSDFRILGLVYGAAGLGYCAFAYIYIEDDIEQRKYFDKGIELFEKSLEFVRKTKDKSLITIILNALIWFAQYGGKINYLQKRIINDLNEIVELGTIYRDFERIIIRSNFTFAIYYSGFAQMSFFTPAQRKSYAKQGIEHGLKALKRCAFGPYIAQINQTLTWSYSQLAALATDKHEQSDFVKKMLEYANQASEIGEKYEGGWGRAAGYSSVYKAYKTLADIAESEEERIKMLSTAIDASRELNKHPIGSRTGIITFQLRLGLLYEELGVLTTNNDMFIKAKEVILNVNKISLERGYISYAAAAFEYVARIENRLGNHTASAKYYEKAQNTYAESLKNIEYKLLKKRVNEKMNYANAWNLIESAKAYHKRENHLKAQESYQNAVDILKNLKNFNYEASYYNAWASQEEAERLCKLEKHEKAIEQYETTKNAFNNAIKSMEDSSKRSKNKFTLERIDKLKKVAKLRIKYCAARLNVEKARILAKQGEHIEAAELFASAAAEFRYVCNFFKVERERGELEAVYFLCRAWETMELAEKYKDPERFAEAANLFVKTSRLFLDSKLKFLASGNASFCQALESGCIFDEESDINIKTELYSKIRENLRKAATSYRKGGFVSGADWALATSTYFDAAWHLIRADKESELEQRKEFLGIGSEYLRSSAELFEKAGNIHKKNEVLERLDMVEKEEKIMFSALNSITKPTISSSTVGIVAPACSLETSQSPRLGEIRQFTEEERRVIEERGVKKKYELRYKDLFKEYAKVQKRECRVAIAQISASQTGNILDGFFEMKTTGLMGLRKDKVEFVRSKVKSVIEEAHDNGVNILLFPEMTIDLNYFELLQDISDLAKIYEMYIIPGSHHDQETRRNISVVIGPDGILWEQEKHIPAIINIGGKRFKEGIEVGALPRKTIICNTEYGRIAIAICRDFLDMDLRVELKNFEPPVDIILNPAFTPVTADFKAAHFDARRSIYAYCFFTNIAEFGDSLIYTSEKERVERTIPPKEEGIIYKDIDLFKLRSERKKWEKEQKKERLFIQSTR